MVLVTATHFLFLTTHNQSEQSVNPLSIIKRRQNHSSEMKTRNKGNHQRKVTNARSLQLTSLLLLFFFSPVFFFFFSQIQEACGGEADVAVWCVMRDVAAVRVNSFWLYSCWFKGAATHFTFNKSHWYKINNMITVNTWRPAGRDAEPKVVSMHAGVKFTALDKSIG